MTIDKRLVNIVKTEFASDLKSKRLCQMVKTIAQNVDELLVRYGSKDQVNSIQAEEKLKLKNTTHVTPPSSDFSHLVQRIENLESNYNRNK